jgi:hypothetical protein
MMLHQIMVTVRREIAVRVGLLVVGAANSSISATNCHNFHESAY